MTVWRKTSMLHLQKFANQWAHTSNGPIMKKQEQKFSFYMTYISHIEGNVTETAHLIERHFMKWYHN
jgi:hypothetical protein